MTHRRLLLFKWLMVLIPPVTVTVGHSLLLGHGVGRLGEARSHTAAETLLVTVLVTLLALVLAYLFVETLFRVLQRLQAEALTREQDILTMNAVMQERERLSRELHDGVAQLVAHLLLRLDTIKELVEANRPEEAEAELERLHGVADEIYEDIGESIAGLRTNVRKHAAAREATVTLLSDGSGQLKVVVADDGRGFTPGSQRNGKASPLGLTSMRERVEALGGTFEVNSQPGSGTQVTATIPISRTRRESGHAALATPPG